MNTIKRFTIYGERCSGTTYLQHIIELNFDAEFTWDYGWKHFFGYDDLSNSDDVLFVCIVRDLYEWLNSFYRNKHNIYLRYVNNVDEDTKIHMFLNNEIYSVNDNEFNYQTWTEEKLTDRNIYTHERYKNVFELRHTKNKYLIEDLPKKVKNYIFIKYEDLLTNFEQTMSKIRDCGLVVRENIVFPVNTDIYMKRENQTFSQIKTSNRYYITREMILTNPNLIPYYEQKLGYL